ncbi:MAG: DciA family protein [Scytonema sp. PMC 1069.18]|nr:DciA family protein [Scytonema sp. PMC 1069.18]MEC4881907.1 DciA family protein [Scytonema sp. PMC 1070.18]
MSFKSINDILSVLEAQAKWQEQPFQRLLKCWTEIVGTKVANYTRPLSIQRNVLWVATPSAAWAQNLTFERKRLLLKLNEMLSLNLVDIHFSTAGWQLPKNSDNRQQRLLPQEHPSYLGDVNLSNQDISLSSQDVHETFQHWAKIVQERSHNLPLCPSCHCPTPQGELQRWGICSLCAAKKF